MSRTVTGITVLLVLWSAPALAQLSPPGYPPSTPAVPAPPRVPHGLGTPPRVPAPQTTAGAMPGLDTRGLPPLAGATPAHPGTAPADRIYSLETAARASAQGQVAATREITGGAIGGAGLAFGLSAIVLGAVTTKPTPPTVLGAIGMAALATGIPFSASASSQAREGLSTLGADPGADMLPVAGWIAYTTSLLLGGTAIGTGIGIPGPASVALGSVSLGTGALAMLLFEVDTLRSRDHLGTMSQAVPLGSSQDSPGQTRVAPAVFPVPGGAVAGVAGRW